MSISKLCFQHWLEISMQCSTSSTKHSVLNFAVCVGFWHNCQRMYEEDNELVIEILYPCTTYRTILCQIPPCHPHVSPCMMSPLPSGIISKECEQAMREWVENYRPVRQRTVRSETTNGTSRSLATRRVLEDHKMCFLKLISLKRSVEEILTKKTVA